MFTNRPFYLLIVIALLIVTACVPSAESNPADRFAGTWSGTMSFTDDANRKEDIIITIQPAAPREAFAAISTTRP
jgi:hypothetical protein